MLSFGFDVMVRACSVAGHHGEEDSVKPSCSCVLMSRKQIGEREVEVGDKALQGHTARNYFFKLGSTS